MPKLSDPSPNAFDTTEFEDFKSETANERLMALLTANWKNYGDQVQTSLGFAGKNLEEDLRPVVTKILNLENNDHKITELST